MQRSYAQMVGEEAFEHRGPLVAFKAGVPIEVDGV
jgi:hypothetical protein